MADTVCADPTCGGADPSGSSFVNWRDVNSNGIVDEADELQHFVPSPHRRVR
ncbi:MAG: hypothetical protein U5K76_07880 [Woeseiaceae bacterium]|nr:hypothetical protein [Woeseiaceae bacterium]